MRKSVWLSICVFLVIVSLGFDFRPGTSTAYDELFRQRITELAAEQSVLASRINQADLSAPGMAKAISEEIGRSRDKLKSADFWLRYLDPLAYKKINAPLPVEWETEVFEKFEAPYKREGAGLTLAYTYLEEEKDPSRDSLLSLIQNSVLSTRGYLDDSIRIRMKTFDHFFLCNRLFLLNLAAIYSTGFECPDTSRVIPELRFMLREVSRIYETFNESYPSTALSAEYLSLYRQTIRFAEEQPDTYSSFDHFRFIRDHVNPLYRMNQQMLTAYKTRSSSFVDYSLNKYAVSIFDKTLYRGQNPKGVFLGITDSTALSELRQAGRLLFYDPILSGNNKRSCASCHKPTEFFTDTTVRSHEKFDRQSRLDRHTPTLLNIMHQHLLLTDGRHYTVESQIKGVITNPEEMGGEETEVMKKIMSCEEYKSVFRKYLKQTPAYGAVTLDHVASAIMLYINEFSRYTAPFDQAMTENKPLDNQATRGFNLFMSKAQCGTCHFVPQFNGVKPPYTNSEFEVLGVPDDRNYTRLSPDPGRYKVNPAPEMKNAFITSTLRNTHFTKPYMHNGVFNSLEEVIDFYDAGGGRGRGLALNNQTLPEDPLKLTDAEKSDLLAFIRSLNEEIPLQNPPASLPLSSVRDLNKRKTGGEY
jgi:cytochrome c peroxidase